MPKAKTSPETGKVPAPRGGVTRRRKRRTTKVAAAPTRRRVARGARKSPRSAKRPFSIVLDARELRTLKEIARKKRCSVAGLIRGAMNVVIFQANPRLARAALEKDVERFFEGVKGKLPMSPRFNGRKKDLKKTLVQGIISEMETA